MKEKSEKAEDKSTWILVIEEDESFRHLLFIVLSSSGYKVALAYNDEDGLELLRKGPYHLVLADQFMLTMDERTIAHKIKEKYPNTPVCLMTTLSREEFKPWLKESEIYSILFKPFSIFELQKELKRLLISD